MVGRSNVLSKEICREQDVDDKPLPQAARDTALRMAQALDGVSPIGRERNVAIPVMLDETPDRSQSSRSSDEAVQQNAVEPRGAGR